MWARLACRDTEEDLVVERGRTPAAATGGRTWGNMISDTIDGRARCGLTQRLSPDAEGTMALTGSGPDDTSLGPWAKTTLLPEPPTED
ncbi:hypothetical protein NDU88_005598 [Pleurodeles waltl]|uniref:Uncharacterized protein n=1 Tax=Pleurodeles waltl TaxID=8319 RepID=A0AAV7W899_PLEWA|nr:hypothetical protein NDU88_005598 [Pleurodeles waltl]